MATYRPIQTSFSAGELSPAMQTRQDLDGYSNAVKRLDNMYPTPQGTAKSRPGFIFEATNLHSAPTGYDPADVDRNRIRFFPMGDKLVKITIDQFEVAATIYYKSDADGYIDFTVSKTATYTQAVKGDVKNLYDWIYASSTYSIDVPDDIPYIATTETLVLGLGHNSDDAMTVFTGLAHEPHMFRVNFVTKVNAEGIQISDGIVSFGFVGSGTSGHFGNKPGDGKAFDFVDNRLVVGGASSRNVNRVYLSNLSSNLLFTPGVTDSDAFNFNLSSSEQVRWVSDGKNRFIGTDKGEYILNKDGTPITPTNISVSLESSYGSDGTPPIKYGDTIVFKNGEKVLAMEDKGIGRGWSASEISLSAEHLSADIKSLNYDRFNGNLILSETDSNEVVGCLYDPSTSQIGWFKWSFPSVVKDVIVVRNQVYVVAVADLYTDKIVTAPLRFDMRDSLQMDFASDVTVYTTTTSISASVVTPYIDDVVIVDITNGNAIVPFTYNPSTLQLELERQPSGTATYRVGVPIVPLMETLPLDGIVRGGTAEGLLKRRSSISVVTIDSLPPLINGKRVAERNPSTPMGEGEPAPVAENTYKVYNYGWDSDATVVITQDKPYQLEISGIFGKVTTGS